MSKHNRRDLLQRLSAGLAAGGARATVQVLDRDPEAAAVLVRVRELLPARERARLRHSIEQALRPLELPVLVVDHAVDIDFLRRREHLRLRSLAQDADPGILPGVPL
jgi:hypothetical protein